MVIVFSPPVQKRRLTPLFFFEHPVWLVGFRPLFFLAIVSGATFPLVWALVFSGWAVLPEMGISTLQWHAHEMLFGFGWAVLGGFLLTASKNWVKIRGLHGFGLAAVTLLWLVERGIILSDASLPLWLRLILLNAFTCAVAGYVLWSLLYYRKNDSFSDNYFFILALPVFLVAKNMILFSETFAIGTSLAIGLFRLAFAVMFERTTTQFMKNAMGVEILRNPILDFFIKASILVAAFQALLPQALAIIVLGLAAVLLSFRFLFWKPHLAFRRFDIAVMYIGYLGLTLHLYAEAFRLWGIFMGLGSLSVHIFTFLCMGVIIPSMLIRISQGHTGRKLVFTTSDRIAIGAMMIASFFRLVATQVWPESYITWISLSALGWTMCFTIIGIRLIPFLFQPRIDGRVH